MNLSGGTSNISMPDALSFTRHGNFVSVMRFKKSAYLTILGSGFCSRTSAKKVKIPLAQVQALDLASLNEHHLDSHQ